MLLAGAGAALVGATEADVCSCAAPGPEADGERQSLAAGARAFVGRVVAKERKSPESGFARVYSYRLRVERSFNVRLGRTLRLASPADGGSCGFEWRKGQRVAGYLSGRRGRWSTNLCSLADPRDLLRDSRPYPAPAQRGRVAALAYGGFSGASVLALDRGGRILGYGFGPRPNDFGPYAASVCPGSRTAVEAGVTGRGGSRLVTRDLATFRQTTSRSVEAFALRCMNAGGSDVVLARGSLSSQDAPARYRLSRLRGQSRLLLRRGKASALALSARFGFTLEGGESRRVVGTDLGNGRSRLLARLPQRADGLAVSPDGTRLAVRMDGSESPRRHAALVVIDLNRSRPRVYRRPLESPFAGGELIWAGSRRLLRIPFSGRFRAYSGRLAPLGRFGRARGGPSALLGDRLLELRRGVLRSVSTRRRAGGRIRSLPTANTSLLLAVPGEPSMTAGARRRSPGRPKVRTACRRSADRG